MSADMFFRRERPKKLTFDDYLQRVRNAGMTTASEPGGNVRISRDGIAATIASAENGVELTGRAGVVMGTEIARLVDGGFQKFFQTPGGARKPALAPELKAVHEFEEDLREALGLTSLYNESLGSVSNLYLYDRVKDRDSGRPPKPWQVRVR